MKVMMNFKYHVNAYCGNHETTLRTNDVRIAIEEFSAHVEECVQCDIMDGTTGEILAIANNPNHPNYATDEMALMILGALVEDAWGAAEAEEAECVDCEDEEDGLPGEPIFPGSLIRCMVCGLPS